MQRKAVLVRMSAENRRRVEAERTRRAALAGVRLSTSAVLDAMIDERLRQVECESARAGA